jgi:two-component system sensor histidine kinase SenX3
MIEIGLARKEIEKETFPVHRVLQRALQHLGRQPAPSAEAVGRVAIPDSAGTVITADFDKTLHVLTILLKNAVAFSPPDAPIEVAVTSEIGQTSIAIKDRGIGMSEETQQRLFEKFFRADNHITRGLGGNGLGLYIAKSFVEIMDGTIRCESRAGKGCIFTVTLPGGRPENNETSR